MANLERKVRGSLTNKALSDISAEFVQNTVLTLNNATTQTITLQRNQSNSTAGTPMYLSVQASHDFYFAWAPTTTDIINTSNSLFIEGGGGHTDLRVRWGAAADATPDTVVFQVKRATANATTVRYVIG